MSGIIYGMINLDGHSLKNTENIQPALNCYQVDSYSEIKENAVFMGCGLLYITTLNQTETLPLYNKDHTRLITADVVLDNRKQLYRALHLSVAEGESKTDSELILLAYDKWGEACPNYLIGDFAFVIWDQVTKQIFCARDATGTRTFYYSLKDNYFCFGSVIKAIQMADEKKHALNEDWFLEFLSTSIVLNQFNYESTPFEGIKQLPPAHSLLITKTSIHLVKYWEPLKHIMPLKLPNDKAYKEAFLDIFNSAVRCRLNTPHPIGILLSGGLDSSAVACLASKALAKQNRILEAFSSIPMTNYKPYTIAGRQANETLFIEALNAAYSNINQHYCKADGETAISDLEHVLDVFEYPYKMLENIPWYRQCLKTAKEQGCKIVLNGQYGNSTISYGNFLTQSLTLLQKGRWFKLAQEIKAFSMSHHISCKRVVKKVLSISIPYKLKQLLKHKQIKSFDYFKYSLLNETLIQKHHLLQRLRNANFYQYPERFYNLKEERKNIIDLMGFTQIASMEMKQSLENGLIIRDPTRDKRLIEFCLSLPGEQFMKDGIERRLIRYSMQDILPDIIRCNTENRGIQGADKLQRLQPSWKVLYKNLQELPQHHYICSLINQEKYQRHLEALNHELQEEDWYEVKMFLLLYICDCFIQKNI